MTDIPGTKKSALKYLAPIIEKRLKLQEEYGNDWVDKPVRCSLLWAVLLLTITLIE